MATRRCRRALGLGYQSDWAQSYLPARRERNAFYTDVGALLEPGVEGLRKLGALDATARPAQITARLRSGAEPQVGNLRYETHPSL